MRDSSKEIEKRYMGMMMTQTPLARLKMVSRMYDAGRKLAISGVQQKKYLNPVQLRSALFMRMYGDTLTAIECRKILDKLPKL